MSEQLKKKIEAANKRIEEARAAHKEITELVEMEARDDLTEDEDKEVRRLKKVIKDEQDVLEDLLEQQRSAEEDVKRSGDLDERVQKVLNTTTTEVREPMTYVRADVYNSYLLDVARMQTGNADDEVKERLRRHAIDVKDNPELRAKAAAFSGLEARDLSRVDGAGGYSVPPLWLVNQFIELARPGRAYANLVPNQVLPAKTNSINIPKVQSGTSTAIQTADNATISDTDLADTFINANVTTIAGQQGIAIQVLDQSPIAFDELVFRDLAADYAQRLDLQVIAGTGSGNQVTGVRNTSGITTITATNPGTAQANLNLVYAKIADAINRIHTQRFMEPSVIVMHPRRWAWFTAAVDSTGRPFVVPVADMAFNPVGVFGGVVSQRVVGMMQGLPVVTDPNMPTTVNTNQDVIHVLRAQDLVLFESGVRARALQETKAQNLTVLLQIYGYLAFTAARYAQSVVEITGSSLAAPAFDGANG